MPSPTRTPTSSPPLSRADYDLSPTMYAIGGVGVVRNENQIVVSGVRFTNTNSDPR